MSQPSVAPAVPGAGDPRIGCRLRHLMWHEGWILIAEAGVRAFLLDYYGVPESNPTFQGIIDRCRQLPPAW